jgi:hypothetical protein
MRLLPFPLPGTAIAGRPKLPPAAALYFWASRRRAGQFAATLLRIFPRNLNALHALRSVPDEGLVVRYTYKGMAAGVFAASVVAVLLMLNAQSGFLPQLDFISLVGSLTGIGTTAAWALHFIFAAVIGGLFAWLDPDLPGDSLRQRGMIFASAFWALLALFIMPLGGLGFLGLSYGVTLPVAALALHLIFGGVLGGTYGWLLLQGAPLRYRHARPAPAYRRAR